MRHIGTLTKTPPAKAYYYNLSLTQKLSEVVTVVSLIEAIVGMLFGRE